MSALDRHKDGVDVEYIRLDARPGTDVSSVLTRMDEISNEHEVTVCCKFNGADLIMQPGQSKNSVGEDWDEARKQVAALERLNDPERQLDRLMRAVIVVSQKDYTLAVLRASLAQALGSS